MMNFKRNIHTFTLLLWTCAALVLNPKNAGCEEKYSDTLGVKSNVNDTFTQPKDTLFHLKRTVVTSSKHKQNVSIPQSYSVLKSNEWEGSQKTIAELLDFETGVQSRRYGGVGSFQTVSIRGIQGSEVLVLLNGIPLNSAMGGAVDLGKINLSQLKEIEVYKGYVPGKFGGNGIGGAVNLKTVSASHNKTTNVELSFGNYGYQKYNFYTTPVSTDTVQLAGSFLFVSSNNNFKYVDRNGTYKGLPSDDPKLDDKIKKVENSYYALKELSLFNSVNFQESNNIQSSFHFSEIENHFPGDEINKNRTAKYNEQKYFVNSRLNFVNESSSFNFSPQIAYTFLRGSTFWTFQDLTFRTMSINQDSISEYYFTNQSLCLRFPVQFTTQYIIVEPTIEITLEDCLPKTHNINKFYGDWHGQQVLNSNALDLIGKFNFFQTTLGASLQAIYSRKDSLGNIDNKDFSISDTLEYIHSLHAGLSSNLKSNFLVYANIGRFTNQPSIRERFAMKGPFLPNDALRPEVGIKSELGIKLLYKNIYVDVCGFYTKMENTILAHRSVALTKFLNSGESKIKGIELNVSFNYRKFFKSEINLTVQDAKNLTKNYEGKYLPNEPTFSSGSRIEVSPFSKLTLQYEPILKSFYYYDPFNSPTQRVPSEDSLLFRDNFEFTHNLKIKGELNDKLVAYISANNLRSKMPILPNYYWIILPHNEFRFSLEYTF